MAVDDSFSKSLLHLNGTDASTTFTDESGKTWTAGGNAQIDTAQSKFGGASVVFDGTGDWITTADSNDWQLDDGSDSNKWTVDFWVRFNGDPGTAVAAFVEQFAASTALWAIYFYNNLLYFQIVDGGSTTALISNAWNPANATWYHVAVVKDGTNGYMMFIDGTQIGTTQTDISTIPSLAGSLFLGAMTASDGSPYYLNGWMDEVRISKGVARWTTNFTPPTTEYVSNNSNFLLMF